MRTLCLGLGGQLLALAAFAQTYSIDWLKISSGGGTSVGGVYSVSGTIGQPDAGGAMTNNQYSVTGGFWSLIQVVQTPGAPSLAITHAGNAAIVSWDGAAYPAGPALRPPSSGIRFPLSAFHFLPSRSPAKAGPLCPNQPSALRPRAQLEIPPGCQGSYTSSAQLYIQCH